MENIHFKQLHFIKLVSFFSLVLLDEAVQVTSSYEYMDKVI